MCVCVVFLLWIRRSVAHLDCKNGAMAARTEPTTNLALATELGQDGIKFRGKIGKRNWLGDLNLGVNEYNEHANKFS